MLASDATVGHQSQMTSANLIPTRTRGEKNELMNLFTEKLLSENPGRELRKSGFCAM